MALELFESIKSVTLILSQIHSTLFLLPRYLLVVAEANRLGRTTSRLMPGVDLTGPSIIVSYHGPPASDG